VFWRSSLGNFLHPFPLHCRSGTGLVHIFSYTVQRQSFRLWETEKEKRNVVAIRVTSPALPGRALRQLFACTCDGSSLLCRRFRFCSFSPLYLRFDQKRTFRETQNKRQNNISYFRCLNQFDRGRRYSISLWRTLRTSSKWLKLMSMYARWRFPLFSGFSR
jgi:hypothetical protein